MARHRDRCGVRLPVVPEESSVDEFGHQQARQGQDQVGQQDDDEQHAEHRQQDHDDVPECVDELDPADGGGVLLDVDAGSGGMDFGANGGGGGDLGSALSAGLPV